MREQTVTRNSTVIRWLIGAAVVLGALLQAFGGLTIAAPWSSHSGAYLADRNFVLAALLVVLLVRRSWWTLAIMLLATAAIHLLDAIVDVPYQNPPGIAGSIVFAVIFAAAAAWLLRHPTRTPGGGTDREPAV
jgi:hypothetical protein